MEKQIDDLFFNKINKKEKFHVYINSISFQCRLVTIVRYFFI